jgi:lysophospholipase L1-like esterase
MDTLPVVEKVSADVLTEARLRIWTVRVVVVVLTLIATFAGLELLLDRYYSAGQSQQMSRFDPVLGWTNVPGDYWNKPLRELHKTSIHINQLGFRTAGEERPAPAGSSVVVLGDSFVVARDSEYSESFPARLERLLNAHMSGGVEVLNAGVPGYGTGQELLLVRQLYERQKIKPNVFLLMFFTNDTLDNLCLSYGDLKFQPIRPCFTLDDDGKPVLTRLPENIPDYADDAIVATFQAPSASTTISIARDWTEEWIQTKPNLIKLFEMLGISPRVPRMPGLLNAWYPNRVVEKGVPLTAALIAQLASEIREHGGRLIVSMIPSPFQIYPETYVPLLQNSFPGDVNVDRFQSDIFRPQRLVRDMCLKAGVPFQDLEPILAHHRDTPLFTPRDGHLNHVGHKLVGEVLEPFVLENMPKDAIHP